MPGHDHNYKLVAPTINEEIWQFYADPPPAGGSEVHEIRGSQVKAGFLVSGLWSLVGRRRAHSRGEGQDS
jgi:hypothetical protein